MHSHPQFVLVIDSATNAILGMFVFLCELHIQVHAKSKRMGVIRGHNSASLFITEIGQYCKLDHGIL